MPFLLDPPVSGISESSHSFDSDFEDLQIFLALKAREKCSRLLELIGKKHLPAIEEIREALAECNADAELLRKNSLIFKTTGVSVGGVGTGLIVAGFVLAPLTAGISAAVLSGAGTGLSVLGAGCGIVTQIVQRSKKKDKEKVISELLEKHQIDREELPEKFQEAMEAVWKCHPGLESFLRDMTPTPEGENLDVSDWLKKGKLHKDEEVQRSDLKAGDHIFRSIRGVPGTYHHGIYINDKTVVERTKLGVTSSSSIWEFAGNQQLYRRDYRGFDLPVEETVALAEKALQQKDKKYHLFSHNCEHFATSLKFNIKWSGQVRSTAKILTGVSKKLPISVTSVIDGVTAAQIAKTVTGVSRKIPSSIAFLLEGAEATGQIGANLASRIKGLSFFKAAPTRVMTPLSKVAVVLAPITLTVDIGLLVYEFKKKNPSIEICKKTLEFLEKEKEDLQAKENLLKSIIEILSFGEFEL